MTTWGVWPQRPPGGPAQQIPSQDPSLQAGLQALGAFSRCARSPGFLLCVMRMSDSLL